MAISGGTFSSDASDYLAKGFSLIANSDGTFGVDRLNAGNAAAVVDGTYYGTLAEAVGAAQDGQTVAVLKDLATAPVTTSAGITLRPGRPYPADCSRRYVWGCIWSPIHSRNRRGEKWYSH